MVQQRTWHYFDEDRRRKWQNPEDILREIGLETGMTFLDIGCGNGFFTLPASRMVGPSGQVFGLDSGEVAIAEIRKKAEGESLSNIHLTVGKAEDLLLCRNCGDILFFGIVLHDFQDAGKVLQNAHRMLKTGGRLANLDWKKREMPLGPPVSVRFDEATAAGLIESAGFKIVSTKDWGDYNYLISASA